MFTYFEFLAHALSLIRNPIIGILSFLMAWFVSYTFLGLFVNATDVVWPLRAVAYISPLGWAYSALIYVIFKDATYDGAVACPIDPENCPLGYVCNGTSAFLCYGYDGGQILSTLHVQYHNLENSDNVLVNCALLLICAGALKAIHGIGVWYLCLMRPIQTPSSLEV